jgi:hypothetical protein
LEQNSKPSANSAVLLMVNQIDILACCKHIVQLVEISKPQQPMVVILEEPSAAVSDLESLTTQLKYVTQ